MSVTTRSRPSPGAWLFYAFSALAAFGFLYQVSLFFGNTRFDLSRWWWVRPAEMAVLAVLCFVIARALHGDRNWGRWLGCAVGVLLLFLFPVGTILGLLILFFLLAGTGPPRRMPKAVVLPVLFVIIVTPLALFVASGAGTHMSSLLLYPFALPWVLLFNDSRSVTEMQALLIGCAINGALLACAGLLVDRRAYRTPSPGDPEQEAG